MNKLASLCLVLIAGVLLYFVFMPEKPKESQVLTVPEIGNFQTQPASTSENTVLQDGVTGTPDSPDTDTDMDSAENVPPDVITPPGLNNNKQPVDDSTTKVSAEQEKEITDFLSAWKQAWQQSAGEKGDIAAYMAFYSADFKAGKLDKKGWADNKGLRNTRKEWIHVLLNNVTMTFFPETESLEVSFTQEYSSSNFSDKSTKQLTIKKEDAGWKILAEQ